MRCKGSTKRWENQNQRKDNTYHYRNIYEEHPLWFRMYNSTDCKAIIVHSIDAVDADAVGPASTQHCFALGLLLCQKPHTTNRLLPLPGPRTPPLPLASYIIQPLSPLEWRTQDSAVAAAAAFPLDQLRLQPPQLLYPSPNHPRFLTPVVPAAAAAQKGEGKHATLDCLNAVHVEQPTPCIQQGQHDVVMEHASREHLGLSWVWLT